MNTSSMSTLACMLDTLLACLLICLGSLHCRVGELKQCAVGVTHSFYMMPGVVTMQAYGEDDYLIFDCPGQIELYSHVTVFRSFVDFLKRDGWNLAAVYTIDCQFVGDPTKFIAGSLQAMSAMVQLELPHVNILTKVDLLGEENKVWTWCSLVHWHNMMASAALSPYTGACLPA